MRMMLLVSASLLMAGGLRADDATPTEKNPALDNDYLVKAHVANNAVIQYSSAAASRVKSEKVKAFAEQLVKDHKECEDKIAKAMKDRKIASVAGTEKELRDKIAELKKLEGNEVDKTFLTNIIAGHEKVLSMCKTQSEKGKDQECCAHAKEAIAGLQKHLDEAKELLKSVN